MKYIFDLKIENDWPPVNAESLWFDEVEQGYRLKSIPFFLPGVAYDDILNLDIMNDAHATVKSIVQPSGNSTIWVYFRQGVDENSILSALSDVGIGSEGGAFEGYFALNLPKERLFSELEHCLSKLIANGQAEMAFGSLRHEV